MQSAMAIANGILSKGPRRVCADLGLSTDNLPSKVDCPKYCSGLLDAQISTITDGGSRRWEANAAFWKFVQQSVSRFGPLRVLHPFCGPGAVARHMAADIEAYLGIDRCPNIVEYARKATARPEFKFECADVLLEETLSNRQNYSLALLDYEVLNGMSISQGTKLIERLAGCLSAHGFIAGDIALAADFLETTRSMTIHHSGSWLAPQPHIEICEIAAMNCEGLVTERTVLIEMQEGKVIGNYQESFWPLTKECLYGVLGSCGFRLVEASNPFAQLSLDPMRLRNNIAFCAKFEGMAYA